MSLSVIIPTFNSVDFLDELINSILKNNFNGEYEVLFGIDSCVSTFTYVKEMNYPDNFKFFYFNENYGPYIIKNTLTELSKYDNIFFFDSDDVMMPDLLKIVSEKLNNFECVKPKFVNFKDKEGKREYTEGHNLYGEGVFGIKKELFLAMNGFEGWKVAADSDFMGRLYNAKRKVYLTPEILFHRRLHSESLTMRPDTGYASQLRGRYFTLSKNKKNQPILDELKTGGYQIYDKETQTLSDPIVEDVIDEISLEQDIKEKKHKMLNVIFQNGPKEIKPKEIKTIDYDKINQVTSTKQISVLESALKKAKLENLKKIYRS
jgi:glycosyltransferase involved in cell wall biosynthesis